MSFSLVKSSGLGLPSAPADLEVLNKIGCSKCYDAFTPAVDSFETRRRGGLMVSALLSGSSGPGSSPGRGHCVVLVLGLKTLYSHSASLHSGV